MYVVILMHTLIHTLSYNMYMFFHELFHKDLSALKRLCQFHKKKHGPITHADLEDSVDKTWTPSLISNIKLLIVDWLYLSDTSGTTHNSANTSALLILKLFSILHGIF